MTIFERLDALEVTVNGLNTDYNHLNGQLVSVEETVEIMLQNIEEIRGMINGFISDKTESINNADLNELYGRLIIAYGNSCLNRPSSANGYLINIPHDNHPTVYNKQIWITRPANDIYIRNMDGGAWGDWTPLHSDTGWKDLPLINGAVAYNNSLKPQYRKIGNQIFLRGVVKNITVANMTFAELPEGFRPTIPAYFVAGSATVNQGGNSIATFYNCQINNDGSIRITTNSIGSYNENYYLRLSGSFLID